MSALTTVGCDGNDPTEACLPSQGCDGVDEVTEIEPPDEPTYGPVTARVVSVHSGRAEAPAAPLELLPPPPTGVNPPSACLVHPDDQATVTIVAHDPEVCASISVHCVPGWTNIDPECGCGCRYIGDEEPVDPAQRPRPVPAG